VGLDRFVGAVTFAAALPVRMLLAGAGLGAVLVLALLLLWRLRPDWVPRRKLPRPRRLAHGVTLSVAYQASIIILLVGTLAATGHSLSPLRVLGAFGASQLAGALPGPNGVSPRDGALVVALAALGVPWVAAPRRAGHAAAPPPFPTARRCTARCWIR
jgi:hypothetical protein